MNLRNLVGAFVSNHPIGDLEGYGVMAEPALDVRWSRSHGTEDIGRQSAPELRVR
jgi:hypothetical protein